MSFILTSSGAIIRKAGEGASTALTQSGAVLDLYSSMAQSTFCARTRKDWIAGVASIPANMVDSISDAVSDLAAMKIIMDDPDNYGRLLEVQTALDVLRDNSQQLMNQLKEPVNQTFAS